MQTAANLYSLRYDDVKTAAKYRKATLLMLLAAVLGYQTAGTIGEWIIKNNLYSALQDFRIGVPGMLLLIFGGCIVINKLIDK